MKISRRGLLLAPLALVAPMPLVAAKEVSGRTEYRIIRPRTGTINVRLAFEATQGERVTIDRCRALFPNLGNFRGYAGKGVL